MASLEPGRSVTTTELLTATDQPFVLSLRLRPPQDAATASQACALPCFQSAAAAAAAPSRELKIEKSKVIAYIRATFRLLNIQKCFERDAVKWQDPLSQDIFHWANDFNDCIEKALRTSRGGSEEKMADVMECLESRIDRLFHVILAHPMERPKIVDNPLIEGDGYIWGEALLKRCQDFTDISPYTQRLFFVKPHEPARVILEWAKEFFPARFAEQDAALAKAQADVPMDGRTFKIIKKNAKTLVRLQAARRQREEAERIKNTAEAFARQTHESNLQMLLAQSIRGELALQGESDARCERLNQRIAQLTDFFEREIASLRAELANSQTDHVENQVKLVRLEVYASALECRNKDLAVEVSMLRQSVACAHRRLNDDGDGNCALM